MAAIAASAPARVTRRRAAKARLGEWALLALTFVAMFVLVYPTGWIFVASFRTQETMFAMRGWVFTVDNYIHLLGSGFARAIFNSLFLCASSVVLSTVVAVVAAYVFSRLRFRRKAPALRRRDARADLPLNHPRDAAVYPVRAARSAQQLRRHDLCLCLGQHSVFDLSARRLSRSGTPQP